MKILILGGNGYVSKRCADVWGDEAILVPDRITSSDDVRRLIDEHQPDAILNGAGVTGTPNVDWCEDNQMVTMLGNTVLPIMIAEAAQEKGV